MSFECLQLTAPYKCYSRFLSSICRYQIITRLIRFLPHGLLSHYVGRFCYIPAGILPASLDTQQYKIWNNLSLPTKFCNKPFAKFVFDRLGYVSRHKLDSSVVLQIAKKYNKTPAQVALRYVVRNKSIPLLSFPLRVEIHFFTYFIISTVSTGGCADTEVRNKKSNQTEYGNFWLRTDNWWDGCYPKTWYRRKSGSFYHVSITINSHIKKDDIHFIIIVSTAVYEYFDPSTKISLNSIFILRVSLIDPQTVV